MSDDNDIDFQKYNNRFREKINDYKAGPVQQRSYTDTWCCAIFVIIFVGFVVLAAILISSGKGYLQELGNSISVNTNSSGVGAVFAKTIRQVVGMIFLGIGLSIIYVVLCSKFPKCVVYTSIAGTLLIFVGLIIVGIALQIYALAVVFAIILAINLLILWCYWNWIQVGIVLAKVSGDFLMQKPSIYFVAGMALFLNIVFQIIWIIAYLAGYSNTLPENNVDSSSRDMYSNLLYLWYAIGVFFGFFLYYCMVFVIATAAAYWYYRQDKNVLSGFSTIRYHLGSITFAAIVITAITLMRRAANAKSKNNQGIIGLVFCLLACILKCIEDLVKVLNHNAVIVMSLTAQDYIDSAKTTISLIFQNFGVFMIIDFFVGFLGIYSLVICVLIPSFLGGYLVYVVQSDYTAAVIGGIIIFLLTWISSSVVLGMLNQAISCMFIFYCFDTKFKHQGINVGNIPPQMKQLFDGARGGNVGGVIRNSPEKNKSFQHTQMNLMANNQIGHQYNNNNRGLGFPNQANYNKGNISHNQNMNMYQNNGLNNQNNMNMYQNNVPNQIFNSGAPQQPQGHVYYQ